MARWIRHPAVLLFTVLAMVVSACSSATPPAAAPAAAPTAAPAAAPAAQKAAAPAANAKTLEFANISAPDAAHKAFLWMADEIGTRSGGSLKINYHPGTLISKEAEIIDAVKAGNVDIGTPAGAASSLFPEMGVFLVPYLVRDYEHAYKMFNGEIGKQLSSQFESKYNLKTMMFYDFGFRHFWNSKRPIAKPDDLKGLKMRVQQGKVFADTVNALGASAVPMGWSEVIPGVQQGVIDGADLPVINIFNNKAYEVSKYASLTYHNYGPTLLVMNPKSWAGLSADQQKLLTDMLVEVQKRIRNDTESVDNLEGAKKLLEPVGMQVNQADVESFRKLAQEKVWPQYQQQYAEMWDKIVGTK